jgi:hypothetical protein
MPDRAFAERPYKAGDDAGPGAHPCAPTKRATMPDRAHTRAPLQSGRCAVRLWLPLSL